MSKVTAHYELILEIIKIRAEIAPDTKLLINGDIKDLAQIKELHEKYPYEPLKHFFKVYINSFDGASDLRVKLMDCKSTDELRRVLNEYEKI